MVGEPLDAERPGEVLGQQPEHLGVVGLAQDIHHAFGVTLVFGVTPVQGQLGAQLAAKGRPVRFCLQQPCVEQLVEQYGVARQVVGRPARGREHGGDALECLRVLVEQGKVGGAPADRLDQGEAAFERGVRLRCFRRLLDQARHQRVITRAARRGQVAIAAAGAHLGEVRQRVRGRGVAQRRKLGGCAVLFQRTLPKGAEGVAAFVVVGEHLFKMPRHIGALARQFKRKCRPVGAAHRFGDEGAVFIARGQFVGLRILEVLQPVLELAQVQISLAQFGHGFGCEQALGGEQAEHRQGGARLQRAVAPAAYQLEDLGGEFDLANAAGAQLDVIGEVAPAHLLADLRVQFAHRADAAVIEVFAEHEGPRQCGELGLVLVIKGYKVAGGHDPRLDPGIALPFAAVRHQILLQCIEAHRQRSAVAPGPQAHVDTEYAALASRLVEALDQAAAELGKILVAGAATGEFRVLRINEYQVDVRGDVELCTTQLAHAHDQHARARVAGLARHRCAAGAQGGADRHFGEGGHGARHFGEVGEAAQVAQQEA